MILRSVDMRDDDIGFVKKLGYSISIGLYALFFLWNSFYVVDPGHAGVVLTFGSVSNTALNNGLQMVMPISSIDQMEVRLQEYTMSNTVNEGEVKGADAISAQASDGLMMEMEFTIQWRLVGASAPKVYQEIGTDLHALNKKVVRPVMRAAIRHQAPKFTSTDMYKTKRKEFENAIFEMVAPIFKEKGIICEAVLLRDVKPPQGVLDAITRKIEADQEAQKMKYVLQKETQEAERKRIEAQGIADFQKIVTQGISEPLLRWKGIEATEALAKSKNSKMVVIGGKDGLPLILNQQ